MCQKSRIVRAADYCIANSKELNTNSVVNVNLCLKKQPVCIELIFLLLLKRQIESGDNGVWGNALQPNVVCSVWRELFVIGSDPASFIPCRAAGWTMGHLRVQEKVQCWRWHFKIWILKNHLWIPLISLRYYQGHHMNNNCKDKILNRVKISCFKLTLLLIRLHLLFLPGFLNPERICARSSLPSFVLQGRCISSELMCWTVIIHPEFNFLSQQNVAGTNLHLQYDTVQKFDKLETWGEIAVSVMTHATIYAIAS